VTQCLIASKEPCSTECSPSGEENCASVLYLLQYYKHFHLQVVACESSCDQQVLELQQVLTPQAYHSNDPVNSYCLESCPAVVSF